MWYMLVARWSQAYAAAPVKGARAFLKAFLLAARAADEAMSALESSTMEWLCTLAEWLLLQLPESLSYLGDAPFDKFLAQVVEDLRREDSLDDTPGVSSAELLEAVARRGGELVRHPSLWQVVSPYAQTGGVGPKLALPTLLADVFAAMTKVAAWSGENVGVPGDPYAFWQSVVDPNGVSDGGWSGPGQRRKR